jgi:hypothetical protein
MKIYDSDDAFGKKNNANQTFIYADHQQFPFERLRTDCQQQNI